MQMFWDMYTKLFGSYSEDYTSEHNPFQTLQSLLVLWRSMILKQHCKYSGYFLIWWYMLWRLAFYGCVCIPSTFSLIYLQCNWRVTKNNCWTNRKKKENACLHSSCEYKATSFISISFSCCHIYFPWFSGRRVSREIQQLCVHSHHIYKMPKTGNRLQTLNTTQFTETYLYILLIFFSLVPEQHTTFTSATAQILCGNQHISYFFLELWYMSFMES